MILAKDTQPLALRLPEGKSLYYDAPFDVRRRLEETFKEFGISASREVVGESLLRLERVCRKATRLQRHMAPAVGDIRAGTLFQMLRYYKSLK